MWGSYLGDEVKQFVYRCKGIGVWAEYELKERESPRKPARQQKQTKESQSYNLTDTFHVHHICKLRFQQLYL